MKAGNLSKYYVKNLCLLHLYVLWAWILCLAGKHFYSYMQTQGKVPRLKIHLHKQREVKDGRERQKVEAGYSSLVINTVYQRKFI